MSRIRRIRLTPGQLTELSRTPQTVFDWIAATQLGTDGDLARLGMGPAAGPILVTRPADVAAVMLAAEDVANRDGALWRPLSRLVGTGTAGWGPKWARSRRLSQPLFGREAVGALLEAMTGAIAEAVDDLAATVVPGQPVDAWRAMTRVAHRALIRAFFGDRISLTDADRLGIAISTAFGAMASRMVLPFAPLWLPLPGDRRFSRAVQAVDSVWMPLVEESVANPALGDDLVTRLVRANLEGKANPPLTAREIRDDIVSMFVAGTETTALAITWFLREMQLNPTVAARVRAEITDVVDGGPVRAEQWRRLPYTSTVWREVMRLWPGGWVLPRRVHRDLALPSGTIRAGATVFTSHYLTHRLSGVWPDPMRFDPDRHLPGADPDRHEAAWYPFGYGRHRCLGQHLAEAEFLLIVATLVTRFDSLGITNADAIAPVGREISLRPGYNGGPVELFLTPRAAVARST